MIKNEYTSPYNMATLISSSDNIYSCLKIVLQTNESSTNEKMRMEVAGFNSNRTHIAELVLNWSYSTSTHNYTIGFSGNPHIYPGYNFRLYRKDNILYLFMKTYSGVNGEGLHLKILDSSTQDYLFNPEITINSEVWDEVIDCNFLEPNPFTVATGVTVDTTFLDASYWNWDFLCINVALNITTEKTYQDAIGNMNSSAWTASGVLIGILGDTIGKVFPIRFDGTALKTYSSSVGNIPTGKYRLIVTGKMKTSVRPSWN